MILERLSQDNVEEYLAYLECAMQEEPDKMTADKVDVQGIKNRISDPFFQNTTSILAKENGNVVGRIEYHFYGCMQDGYKMAYVDWVYVRKPYRHRGIAQMLFRELEKECVKNDIDQYYLIRAVNTEAERFYRQIEGAKLSAAPLLRKYIKT